MAQFSANNLPTNLLGQPIPMQTGARAYVGGRSLLDNIYGQSSNPSIQANPLSRSRRSMMGNMGLMNGVIQPRNFSAKKPNPFLVNKNGYSSLGQQQNAQGLMPKPLPNNRNVAPQNNTPSGFNKNNLLNYISSPQGKGMAQGLLEASGYSKTPVSFGQALALGMQRGNEAEAIYNKAQQYEDAKNFRQEQFKFEKESAELDRGLKKDQIDATLKVAENKIKKYQSLTKEEVALLGLDADKSYQREIGTNNISQIGGGGTTINLGDKVGLEKEKSALKLIEAEYNKNVNASSNKVAINQMRSASESFKTGALADTRIFIGQAADLVGLDSIASSELLKPSSGEAFKSAQAKLVRQLADGLVNLNKQELIMLQNNYPKVSNTREGNALLFDIYEKEYDSQEKQLQIISEYYSSNMTLKEYNQANQKIKNNYSKEVKTILDEYNGGLNKFNKLITDNIGTSGTGRDINGESISITVQKGDTYLGLNDDGMPMYSKPNGTQYSMIIEE